jgi:glycerophosphoryl diester phosphodiesterase
MIALLASLAMIEPPKPSTTATIAQSWKQTLVVGHRGAAAYKPENTLSAFEEGIACNVAAVECDVHLSQDGEMVIMHDKTLDRTTSLKGKVSETLWATMKSAGIPSLADLTKVTKDRVVLVVEIKDGVGVERKVVNHLNDEKMKDQSIIFSFGADYIKATEQYDPGHFSVWLIGLKPVSNEAALDQAARIGANGVGISYKNVTPEFVRAAHDRKLPVFVWTVPPGEEVDRLKAMKVNFIITDHPRDVRTQLGL